MRSFIIAALAGIALAQEPYDQCKADIADAQDALAPVLANCEAQGTRLGALAGNIAPINTVLPYQNEQVVANSASIAALQRTNDSQATVI